MQIEINCPYCDSGDLEKIDSYEDTEKNTFDISLKILSVNVLCKSCDKNFTVQKLYLSEKEETGNVFRV